MTHSTNQGSRDVEVRPHEIPLHVFSEWLATAGSQDQLKTLPLGIDDCCVKPSVFEDVNQKIRRILKMARRTKSLSSLVSADDDVTKQSGRKYSDSVIGNSEEKNGRGERI